MLWKFVLVIGALGTLSLPGYAIKVQFVVTYSVPFNTFVQNCVFNVQPISVWN